MFHRCAVKFLCINPVCIVQYFIKGPVSQPGVLSVHMKWFKFQLLHSTKPKKFFRPGHNWQTSTITARTNNVGNYQNAFLIGPLTPHHITREGGLLQNTLEFGVYHKQIACLFQIQIWIELPVGSVTFNVVCGSILSGSTGLVGLGNLPSLKGTRWQPW